MNLASRLVPQRGFTLIELLVVMVLLALLMTGLMSAMRTMAQTESRIDQHLQRLDDLRTVRSFLSQTFSRISNAKIDNPEAIGRTMVPFVATPNSITWVGTLPVRPGTGGRHYFRLAVEDTSGGSLLVLRLSPCGPDMRQPLWSAAERHPLLNGVSRLDIQAKGLPARNDNRENPWPKGWQTGWPVTQDLPEQIRISLKDDHQREIIAWIFAPHAFLQSDASISSVTVGGANQ